MKLTRGAVAPGGRQIQTSTEMDHGDTPKRLADQLFSNVQLNGFLESACVMCVCGL